MNFCRSEYSILVGMTHEEYAELLCYLPGINRLGVDLNARSGREVAFSHDAWDTLLLSLGYALADAALSGDAGRFWGIIKFANHMTVGDPRYTPYRIPEDTSKLPAGLEKISELRQVEKERPS